jgi:hypothetical protein
MFTSIKTKQLEAMINVDPTNLDILDELCDRYGERIGAWLDKHPANNGHDTPYLTGCWNKYNAAETKLKALLAV